MDATLKHSIQQRARYVLQKELADHGERYEQQKAYLEANVAEAEMRLKAIQEKEWNKTERESYDYPKRFTRDKA